MTAPPEVKPAATIAIMAIRLAFAAVSSAIFVSSS
jgi:hypothetical protein